VHELALSQAIAESVAEHAAGRPVTLVQVRVGHLRQVVPESLAFAWELLTENSELDGARLEIEHVPAVVSCRRCGITTRLDLPVLLCGACSGTDLELRSGNEFDIRAIEMTEVA
jgi:hydrogenase nickel incorporation protein HypA/HybF